MPPAFKSAGPTSNLSATLACRLSRMSGARTWESSWTARSDGKVRESSAPMVRGKSPRYAEPSFAGTVNEMARPVGLSLCARAAGTAAGSAAVAFDRRRGQIGYCINFPTREPTMK